MAKDIEMPKHVDELICFAVYSASHAISRAYNPLLKKLDLTYPQYITLTVLWEKDKQTVGALCERLLMDSSTVTPLVKRLEALGHVERKRGEKDERQVFVSLTQSGIDLQEHADNITRCIVGVTGQDLPKLDALVKTLSKLRDSVAEAIPK